MSETGAVSLDLIGKILLDIQTEQRAIRAQLRDMQTIVLAVADQGRRIERRVTEIDRRFNDQRDDLELMIKAELMGRLGNFEIKIEHRLDAFEERMRP
jgi:predicted  nucleic acid-binding Zn-ribbon protein